jgi:hypothetical protein
MRYHHFEMLPEDGFQHCGNGKIRLHGGGNPFSFISDAVSSIGNAFEDVIGTVGDALSGLDDWVREEIPGGWLLPAAAVAAVATGGTSLAALGEAGAVEGAAAAGGITASSIASGTLTAAEAAELAGLTASSVTSSVGIADLTAAATSGAYGSTVASLVSAGVPANMAMALPSVSTLASNAAVNAAMQIATTGKVNVDSLVKSLAMGSVSSVVGAGVSGAVGSAGMENPLLASIANSAAQGATGAVLSGRNPVTAALASALSGGVGYATQGSGLPQTAVNTTINALASGQSVQNALISAAIAAGSSEVKNQIKGFFQDIGSAQGKTKEETGQAFEDMVAAKKEQDRFTVEKQEEFTQAQATIDGKKEAIDAFQELRGQYDSKIESYEKNKELATNTAAYETEMRNRGYEQFLTGEGDPIYGPNGWAQRTGGHWVTYYDEDNQPRQEYAPDYADEDSNSIKYIPAPSQHDFVVAANSDVKEVNSLGEQLNIAATGSNEGIDRNALQSTISQQQEIYGSNYDQYRSLTNTANNFGEYLSSLGYAPYGGDGWAKLAPDGESFEYGGDDESRHPIWYSGPSQGDLYNQANEYKQKADAAQSVISDATAKLKNADFIDKYGVKDVIAANKTINDNVALYKDLSTATTKALETLNTFVPPEKLSETLTTELTTQAKEKADAEQAKADKLAQDAKDAQDKADAQAAAEAAQKQADEAQKLADEQAKAKAEADKAAAEEQRQAEEARAAEQPKTEKQPVVTTQPTAEEVAAATVAAEQPITQAQPVTEEKSPAIIEEPVKAEEPAPVEPELLPATTPVETAPEGTPEVKTEPSSSDNFIDPSKPDFRMPVTDEEKKAYQDFADQTDPTKIEIIGGGETTETPLTPAPDQGEVPTPPPVEIPEYENPLTPAPDQGEVPTPPPVELPPEKTETTKEPEGCQPPFVDDGFGRCILPEDKEKEETPIPDCGPGMVWSLTDNACVPVADITKPVVTPITPKPPVTTPVTPTKPAVTPAVDPAIAAAQSNQNKALLMGLLLGQQPQAPQQPQAQTPAKITPYDWNKDILGAEEYFKATQQPYAAGGGVHSINDELIKLLRS